MPKQVIGTDIHNQGTKVEDFVLDVYRNNPNTFEHFGEIYEVIPRPTQEYQRQGIDATIICASGTLMNDPKSDRWLGKSHNLLFEALETPLVGPSHSGWGWYSKSHIITFYNPLNGCLVTAILDELRTTIINRITDGVFNPDTDVKYNKGPNGQTMTNWVVPEVECHPNIYKVYKTTAHPEWIPKHKHIRKGN